MELKLIFVKYRSKLQQGIFLQLDNWNNMEYNLTDYMMKISIDFGKNCKNQINLMPATLYI